MKNTFNSVKNWKVYSVLIKSWISFMAAFIILTAMWLSCMLVVLRFAPGAARLFFLGIVGAAVFGTIILIFNEPLVVLSMGAKRIKSREQSPRLWDAVHSVTPSIARPVPRIYLVDTEGMNAFAFGLGLPFLSAVGATKGIIDNLDQNELEAVMAHEIGHIANKDILVSTAMTIGVMTLAFSGWLLLNFGRSSSRSYSENNGGAAKLLLIPIIGGGLYLLGRIFGGVLQLFVSRQREYAADASSSKIMGTSKFLASALEKISRNPEIGSTKTNAALGFLCTADPDPSDFLSTHPSMKKRLAALAELES